MKERKKRMGDSMRARLWLGSIVAALIVAVSLYVMMLQIEKNMLADYEKGNIYVAIKDIPKGEIVKSENYEEYFGLRQLDKSCIPQTAITQVEQVQNLVAAFPIEKGVLLTSGMFEALNDITAQMKEPVIAGFKAEDLYQVVSGVLRAGDRVHIYSVQDSGEEALIWKNVYVQQVFDNAGKIIGNDDLSTAAQRINIYMEEKDIEQFYTKLSNGALRVVKVVDY